jgi:2-polyprenyl-6-methoxyphenol hydroxylase-like FAD-dependent oxidoreductase
MLENPEVLIIGAGPTGLVLALWLTKMRVRVRIVDRATEPGTSSRALAVQARTLELYRTMGLADDLVARGRRIGAVNLWVGAKRKAHISIGEIGSGLSPFPYALIFPQDEHERVLIEHLKRAGVEVERGTELLGFEEASGLVKARLRRAGAEETACSAAYIAGCDGAHSVVRTSLGIGFPGGTYDRLFYVADVEADGPMIDGELHLSLDEDDFLAVFPMKAEGRARLIGTVRADAERQPEELSWADVSARAIERTQTRTERVNWFSAYRVHHRVAARFREGRAFLVGDAAHIHSPVGGQGMNTGIGDAVNLAWKLAAALRGRSGPWVLDTYEPERIAFARRLVATTDRVFQLATERGALARKVRTRVVPPLMSTLSGFRGVQRLLFRTVSQTEIRYRESPLSEGAAGRAHGGDRLPWVVFDEGRGDQSAGEDNFASLNGVDWQAHIYGDDSPRLRAACEARAVDLRVLPWGKVPEAAGLMRNALYLVRPDGYVALADAHGDAEAVDRYLDRLGDSRVAWGPSLRSG